MVLLTEMEKPDKTAHFTNSKTWRCKWRDKRIVFTTASINKALDRLQVVFKVKKEIFKPLNHSDVHISPNTIILWVCVRLRNSNRNILARANINLFRFDSPPMSKMM